MKSKNRWIATAVGVGLLLLGLGGARAWVKTKPQAQRSRKMSSMIPVVETAPWSVGSCSLKVEGLGTVVADQLVALKPEVSGRVVAVRKGLVEGCRVRRGELLVELDPADYRLACAQAKAALLAAQSRLRIEEGNQAVARHEMALMPNLVDESYRDLMARAPQLASSRAEVNSAQAALGLAELNLERTKIRAPFDGVVVRTDADVGDSAQPATELLRLAATDRYLVRASIPIHSLQPLSQLGQTPYSAQLILSDGAMRAAQTDQLLPDLTETGRMAQLLLAVDAPYAGPGRPLLLGEVVRFEIAGERVDDVAHISREYLRDGDVVWMLDREQTLRILPADVLHGSDDEVVVRVAGAEGLELVTTDLAVAVDGMTLRRVGTPAVSEATP